MQKAIRCARTAAIVSMVALVGILYLTLVLPSVAQTLPTVTEGDYVITNYTFKTGESLPQVKLHYRTIGKPDRNSNGQVTNAVLVLHGTGGNGAKFVAPPFAGVLFNPGQLLDANRYYIIVPDNVGHGKSTKPSDGLHARFPQYDYDDMVDLQHRLLVDGLKVNHLRLIMGTSMGCMHSFVWGETFPDFMDALMPMACNTIPIAGRNRIIRKIAIDAIIDDPGYNGGEYKVQPAGLNTAIGVYLILMSSPLQLQKDYPTGEQAAAYLDQFRKTMRESTDANDVVYAFRSSRNYNPSPALSKIKVPVMAINSADDFVNPPESGSMEKEIKKIPKGQFVLLPMSDELRGHGTHSLPLVWQDYLRQLLARSAK
jgi:homoserine O-acetyltransferase